MWFADGSNYPGTANIRHRKRWFDRTAERDPSTSCRPGSGYWSSTNHSNPRSTTPISLTGGWRCFLPRCGTTGKVLVDTGHHYAAQNIEQIVAWLLSEDMLGGFHFNDRRYADDDLTMGSIDPYQVFRIFHEICYFEWETGGPADIAYMVDQSHNLKGKIEAMIQTVTMAQELYSKAALVDHQALAAAQKNCELVRPSLCCRMPSPPTSAQRFRNGGTSKGLARNPMEAFRQSGYLERITKERAARNSQNISSYA